MKEPTGLETKGVDSQGRPAKAKHSRGRELYRLRRQEKLLRYAARLKLSGNLIDGERVSARTMKMRSKLQALKERIDELSELKQQQVNNSVGSIDWTGINQRATIDKISTIRYSSRQRDYKWLPTHVWHAKRAHMVKRWGFNVPYEPTMKCFRQTSRQSRIKGCVGFDTSYMNTVILKGDGVFVLIGELTNDEATGKKYHSKGRVWEGFLMLNGEHLCRSLIWWIKSGTECVLRFHPSVYDVLLDHLVNHAKNVEFEDCRYSLGSLTVTGPQSLWSLASVLHPSISSEAGSTFEKLAGLNEVSALPVGSTFSMFIDDPRLWPKPVRPTGKYADVLDLIIDVQNGKATDRSAIEALFSKEGRVASYHGQPSLKQLGQRRTPEFLGKPIPKLESDPQIPVVIVKTTQGLVLFAPWHWILPIWHQLVHVPHFSMGGTKQLNQLGFEKGELGFADCVFTRAGFLEGQLKMKELATKWSKRPKSKRFNISKLNEAGSPFGCDWRYLQLLWKYLGELPEVEDHSGTEFTELQERVVKTKRDVFEKIQDTIQKDETLAQLGKPVFAQLPIELYRGEHHRPSTEKLPLVAIQFSMLNRGHPHDNARIYKIPETEYSSWMDAANKKTIQGRTVALEKQCPGKEHLIGYVTSATFNLAQGKGTGVGFIASKAYDHLNFNKADFVLVRNVGSTACHLAQWKLVAVQ
ncbi:hypothetical protein OGAPHI_001096 [Ogataea philodendri]|uniref:Uncharacterized protein n=1 Tax=Ogataea philodendri TaxID=1378263 RepID=A0A9P8T9Z9_9ASCO|nr:uncharacterized protein OGAPHI_001096 [Ogataea philodendri]KAH3670581.1 hypothetical protein OGAPHI_001096 [Ogataea philodendri]